MYASDPASGCKYKTLLLHPDIDYRHEHFHEDVELVYVWEGEILCEIEGEQRVLPKGRLIVFGSRIIHRLMYLAPGAQLTYLQINIDSIIASLLPDYHLLSCILDRGTTKYGIFSEDSDMGRLFYSILHELEKKDYLYEVSVRGSIYQLITLMCRAKMMNMNTDLIHQKNFKKILPALLYARDNFAQKISLDKLCSELKIDKYHFCKQFKKTTGITFFDYLGYLRLQNAEELLITTNKNITEIGLECGFSSLQYFNRFFSEHKGYSPTAYRKMLRQE